MMMDIFSSFDPALSSTYNNFFSPMFWLTSMFSISMLTTNYWASPTRLSSLMHVPMSFMYMQANQTMGKHMKGFIQMICPMFLFIITTNMTGILPYTFGLSSHLFYSLSMALPMWMTMICSSIFYEPTMFIALLLPGHAPNWLNPFLVIIETLSTIVRPLTLSFRLAANMSAGHIVLALMGAYSSAMFFTSMYLLFLFIMFQMGYLMFESAICLIQSYIFCLLLSLYTEDHSLKLNL